MFITPAGAVAALAGLAYLSSVNVRADRRIFRHLAIGTAVCVALVAITFTPYGQQVQFWLLD